MNRRFVIFAGLSVCALWVTNAFSSNYSATIQRTTHGLPHITGKTLSEVFFGQAFALAEDNYCLLAEEILAVRGESAKIFGAGIGNENVVNDLFVGLIDLKGLAIDAWDKDLSGESKQHIKAYVSGLNHYINIPKESKPHCLSKKWITSVSERDIVALHLKMAMFASSVAFKKALVGSKPPKAQASKSLIDDFIAEPTMDHKPQLGSNAWALGKDRAKGANAIVLANPHFPWRGIFRFYQSHLIVPEELNVIGGSLIGVPGIQIGTNSDVAWTHTVSDSIRYNIYRLELSQDNPFRYRLGDQIYDMERKSFSIKVKQADDTLAEVPATYFKTKLGPILTVPDLGVDWTREHVYVLADANVGNARGLAQWLEIARSRNIIEIRESIAKIQGIPWVNIIAADITGDTYFADAAVVPNLPDDRLVRCFTSREATYLFRKKRIAILDGSNPSCLWHKGEAFARQIMPFKNAPSMTNRDYVTNFNDSHWLANLEQPLEGFDQVYGFEKTERSLRTRLGLLSLKEAFHRNKKLDRDQLLNIAFSNRTLAGELFHNQVIRICLQALEKQPSLTKTCRALKRWDQKMNLSSEAAHLFAKFMQEWSKKEDPALVPFDANKPIETPRGIVKNNNQVLTTLSAVSKHMEEFKIPLTAKLAEVQFFTNIDKPISVPGGPHEVGILNVIDGKYKEGEGLSINYGASLVLAMALSHDGPSIKGLLTYSQSTKKDSKWFDDQTRLYSLGKWVNIPYRKESINQDPNLVSYKVEFSQQSNRKAFKNEKSF